LITSYDLYWIDPENKFWTTFIRFKFRNLNNISIETVFIFLLCFALFSLMVVPVDAPNVYPAKIEHHIVLPVLLLEDVHDSGNAKSKNPPPPPPKLEISLGDAKVEDAPPPILVVCIDQREHFTTTHKFATQNDLLEWVREKVRKLDFSMVIGKFDNSGNGRSAFVTLMCERGGSYTE